MKIKIIIDSFRLLHISIDNRWACITRCYTITYSTPWINVNKSRSLGRTLTFIWLLIRFKLLLSLTFTMPGGRPLGGSSVELLSKSIQDIQTDQKSIANKQQVQMEIMGIGILYRIMYIQGYPDIYDMDPQFGFAWIGWIESKLLWYHIHIILTKKPRLWYKKASMNEDQEAIVLVRK